MDLAIIHNDGIFDLDIGDGGETTDDGLRTAVIISLFTDRIAAADDVLTDGTKDRRGWWGDVHPEVEADRIGSKLWLITREKRLQAVVLRAETYAREALQWMIEDGIATAVTVAGGNPLHGILALEIRIDTVARQDATYRVILGAPGAYYTDNNGPADESGGIILDESGMALLD